MATIAGKGVNCNTLPAMNAMLAYNGEDAFRGWTESDHQTARALIKACKMRFFDHGKTETMLNLLESRWVEDLARASALQQQEQQRQDRAQQRAARLQSDADAFSAAHRDAHSGRAVRIFFISRAHLHTGDSVPAESLNTILFTEEPCQMPVAGAPGFHRAWMNYATNQLGCWYPTIDDGYVFVGSLPQLTHASQEPWEAFPRALLHPDGSATITEPDYDSVTFQGQVSSRKVLERMRAHRNEKP